MQKRNKYFFMIALLVMLILFISSSQTYEQQSQISLLSQLLANEPFKNQLEKISFVYGGSEISIATKGYFAFVEFFIRKLAHFSTFFVLGSSIYLGLKGLFKNMIALGLISWFLATSYAVFDEYHQMLTGGRTPLIQDVALDSFGAGVGILLCTLILFKKRKIQF